MDEEAKAYSDHIQSLAKQDTQRAIENMTPEWAIRVIKEAADIVHAVPDPKGVNLRVELQLNIVALWLARMEGQA
jgi:hypothetical protein